MAHDVTDDERDPAARQRYGVVPVAADPGRLGRGQVAGGQPHPGGLREAVGQHGALEFVGDVRLAAVEDRLVDAERGVGGQLGRDQQVVLLEGGTLRAAQEHRGADHPPPAAQRRQDRPVAARQRMVHAEQLRQCRPGAGGGREDGPYAAQHLGERAAGPDLAQLGRGQVTLRADQRQLAEVELAGGPRGPGEVHPRADGAADVRQVVDRPEPVGAAQP